ncbi:MAG: cation diffusion facilitator family transporter [Acutalibacteraceae bacterium]|jgi:cation diffusion facilitator family transporter
MDETVTRQKQITRTSAVGIVANVFLAAFKAAVGLIAGSIAVVLDAINNLTDAVSSVVTIIGVKLAQRPPDKKHPYGHGRIEYFTAVIIAAIVLAAGVLSLSESVQRIFTPEPADYSFVSVIIIVVAVVTKLILGRYVKGKGQQLRSDALIASGSDATFDAILSASTLVGALVTMIWHVSIDGIVGVLIAAFIIKAGIEMMLHPLGQILGIRADGELTRGIRQLVESVDGVRGAYDLMLHDYGPQHASGSVHVEVDENMTARQIHKLTRAIQMAVYERYRVIMTVGVYAVDTTAGETQDQIRHTALAHDGVMEVHGIFVDDAAKMISLDIVVDFDVKERDRLAATVRDEIAELFPEYRVMVNLDADYSD